MVDLYDGPCREGIRGGLEQFKWDSVKVHAIRDRECYLGQSVKIGIQGKFGRFSTNDWWINKREDPTALQNEKELLKKLEDELILEAIGAKPKRFSLLKGELSEAQKLELMALNHEKDSLHQHSHEPKHPSRQDSKPESQHEKSHKFYHPKRGEKNHTAGHDSPTFSERHASKRIHHTRYSSASRSRDIRRKNKRHSRHLERDVYTTGDSKNRKEHDYSLSSKNYDASSASRYKKSRGRH